MNRFVGGEALLVRVIVIEVLDIIGSSTNCEHDQLNWGARRGGLWYRSEPRKVVSMASTGKREKLPRTMIYQDWMSDGDALMWHIERDPLLRSTVVSVWVLDSPPDAKRFAATLERTMRHVPRLRQRVVEDPLGVAPPRWEADPLFELPYHVRHVRAPGAGTVRDLLDMAAPIAMQAFDKDRPLWELHCVEGLD